MQDKATCGVTLLKAPNAQIWNIIASYGFRSPGYGLGTMEAKLCKKNVHQIDIKPRGRLKEGVFASGVNWIVGKK